MVAVSGGGDMAGWVVVDDGGGEKRNVVRC